jgi:hypothetical protein
MSTAGKVLIVIVMLMAIAWIALSAGVAQLNRSWAALLDQDKTNIEKLETDRVTLKVDLAATRDQAALQQLMTANEIAVRESEISEKEKARAQALETATRVKIQLEGMEATLKASLADQEQRKTDLTTETEEKDKLSKSVATMDSENKALLAHLTELREKFRNELNANRQKAGLPALNLNP